jgi:hypothetical protein
MQQAGRSQGHSAAGRLGKLKKSNHLIDNQTCNLPAAGDIDIGPDLLPGLDFHLFSSINFLYVFRVGISS